MAAAGNRPAFLSLLCIRKVYQPEEEAGFRKAAATRVPVADLIWLRSTAFRLIRKGTPEPWRGTLCTLGDES